MYRRTGVGAVEVLLAHPGGPYWARKDDGAWTLPKGECENVEEALACACREFEEETGQAPTGPFSPLGEVRQKSGKRVQAWSFEADMEPTRLQSNLFEMEWPPGSGQQLQFPEVDRVAWFGLHAARIKLLPAQSVLIDRLAQSLSS